jgi:hypothetical protein
MLDWSLPTTPLITATALEFPIKGLFFPKNGQEVEPSVGPATLPLHDDASTSKFQVFISDYLADSLCSSFLQVHDLHFWTKAKDIPSSFFI